MAGTTISNSTTVGVTVTTAAQNPVTITSAGTVSVSGTNVSAIYVNGGIAGTVTNSGTLTAPNGYGIFLHWGGSITNGGTADTTALISGGVYGVRLGARGPGTVTNFATVTSANGIGLFATDAFAVTNGSTADKGAVISGYNAGVEATALGTVTNFATIKATGSGGFGVYLRQGGVVTNGSATDTTATITGADFGIEINHGAGAVTNYGTITGTGSSGHGIDLNEGGSVSNGTSTDTTAFIKTAGPHAAIYIAGGQGTVVNYGTVMSASRSGVNLLMGGTVTNGSTTDTKALLSGGEHGVYMRGDVPAVVLNFGTISSTTKSAVVIYAGIGVVTNGATNDTAALIGGGHCGVYLGVGGTITNYGKITGANNSGIYMGVGGTVTNGTATDKTALIATLSTSPDSGIFVETGATTITNFATISSANATGVSLSSGGAVTNGSAADVSALIAGAGGGVLLGSGGTVSNYGMITASGGSGVDFAGGGQVTNGSTADTTALITGIASGIFVGGAAGTITNFGTITATTFESVELSDGGDVTNGSTADTTAKITEGVAVYGAAGTVANFGTISSLGIGLSNGGDVTNGTAADTAAEISCSEGIGFEGIFVNGGAGTVANFGTISSTTDAAVEMAGGGVVTNGSTTDTTATITGPSASSAIFALENTTVTNFGTLTGGSVINFFGGATGTVTNAGNIVSTVGTTGTAISFSTGTNRLVVDPGANFVGNVTTGGGTDTLELAGTAAGTFSGIGSQFTGFNTVAVDTGAAWTLTGANTAATVDNLGTLALAASGALDVTGTVAAASTGTFALNTSSILTIAADPAAADKMKFLGSGELIVANASSFGLNVGTPSYAGPLIENFVAGDSIDLANVLEPGTVLNYTTATGLLQVTNGSVHLATLAFQNATLGSGTFEPGNDGSGHLLITLS